MPFSGVVTRKRRYKRTLDGTLQMLGSIGIGKSIKRTLEGVLSMQGALTSLSKSIILTGYLTMRGGVTRIINGTPVGKLIFKITNILKITIG